MIPKSNVNKAKTVILREKAGLMNMLHGKRSLVVLSHHDGIDESAVCFIKKQHHLVEKLYVHDPFLSGWNGYYFFFFFNECKAVISVPLNLRKKAKSWHTLFKQRNSSEGTRMNYTAFGLARVGLNKFRTRFGSQNVKIIREAASINHDTILEEDASKGLHHTKRREKIRIQDEKK